jgi:hypothetical protein
VVVAPAMMLITSWAGCSEPRSSAMTPASICGLTPSRMTSVSTVASRFDSATLT